MTDRSILPVNRSAIARVQPDDTCEHAICLETDLSAGLSVQGWAVQTGWLAPALAEALAKETTSLMQAGGASTFAMRADDVGMSAIRWIRGADATSHQQAYLARLDVLRTTLRQSLQLNLGKYEGHLAYYARGASYRRHLDNNGSDGGRMLTCILYLNSGWSEQDGGQLRIHTSDSDYVDVLPEMGTLVIFYSRRFWHEVLPTRRDRICVPGWFHATAQ